MTRVDVMVEGQTEETFVRELLYDPLVNRGVFLYPILLRTSAQGKGGVVSYGKVRSQVLRQCLSDASAKVTTMIDLFRLPKDFPEKQACAAAQLYSRVDCLEQAFASDIGCGNFVPYLSVHEFEGLLFSDATRFANWFDEPEPLQQLNTVATGFQNPEHINDGAQTAPSKRIESSLGRLGYQKPVHGPLIAMDIGLDCIRAQCPHFDAWVTKLEGLGV
ncbi:DUF4276 family protein [Thiorhodococcus mannitoliphagus]|uniref:DUF4276 family protein n=1 Tax=Thiorhodococcus mannitoliphagus TaxID=329406 RepID=A0A6P1DTB7_9GAMM|nr:DUF4276 family protein [Thiorhodococcus mannitoliphagus]NEX20181.1 DUF4276 family protein [Thiorhodococcus mannitoliphagus]